MDTLADAKQHLNTNWQKGTTCPVCTQNVKLYEYPIYGSMAKALILLYKLDKSSPGFHHINDFAEASSGKVRASHFAEFRWRGLVEPAPHVKGKEGKSSKGLWRITDEGRAFVENRTAVMSHVLVFNNTFFGFGPKAKLVKITDCLDKDVDYNEIMSMVASQLKMI